MIEATCEEMKNKGFIIGKKGEKLEAAETEETEKQNNEEFLSILNTTLDNIEKKETVQAASNDKIETKVSKE